MIAHTLITQITNRLQIMKAQREYRNTEYYTIYIRTHFKHKRSMGIEAFRFKHSSIYSAGWNQNADQNLSRADILGANFRRLYTNIG